MKKIYLFTLAAALFAACASDDLGLKEQPQAQAEKGAVTFDAYTQRGVTRAGYASADMNLAQLQEMKAKGGGFGVFGYYTDNHDYDQTALPNFMYNQGVFYSTTWTYSPLMYWPNEYGYNAESDDFDKVTFFAYAPYVEVTPATGKLSSVTAAKEDEWGIVGMTRNSNAGDPILKYIASFDNKNAVDLLWGVCNQADWTKIQAGDVQEFTIGKPWLDVQRPAAVDQKLKFTFKHATAKLTVKVDEFNDAYELNGDVPATTRIWIRSVRFTGFTMKGALNLNNEEAGKPYWLNFSGLGDLVADGDVVVYDGRKDGKEGTNGGVATNEKVLGLADQFVENETVYNYGSTTAWQSRAGVNATPTSLFKNTGTSGNDYFYVIPTDDDMEIEIIYDVETIDQNLYTTLSDGKTKGSHIENKISKKITFGSDVTKLEAGKAYVVNLHLGMNDVDFDADIVDWDEMAKPDVDLPANMPAFAAKSTSGKLEIPGADNEFVFAITGLKGGEAITTIETSVPGVDKDTHIFVHSTSAFPANVNDCDKRANASGVVYVKVKNVTPNETIADLAATTVSLTGAFTAITTLNVIQKAEPLALSRMTPDVGNKTYEIQVKRSDSDVDLKDYITGVTAPSGDNIRVWYDGAELAVVTYDLNADPANENKVQLTWTPGSAVTLTFNTARDNVTGKDIKLYLKAGDVPAETITVNSKTGANVIP